MNKKELAEKKDRFRNALDLFVSRVREDRYIIGVVLVGRLSEETIWRKDGLRLWVIEVDGVTKRMKSDGNDDRVFRSLVEDDINLHLEMIPRSRFKQMVEGSSRTAFSCNFFAHRELVYCDDPSLATWFETANETATKDQEKELLVSTTWAICSAKHARKQIKIKKDLELARQTLMWGAHSVAAIEIIKAGEVYEQEAIYKAIELEPKLFKTIYLDPISKKPTAKTLTAALEAIEDYIDQNSEAHLKPLLKYLKKQKGIVPLSELSIHFAYSQLYPWHLESACEWLTDNGYVEKLSAPFRLTKKSRVDVEEPAYQIND
jgi:hypothetical protein